MKLLKSIKLILAGTIIITGLASFAQPAFAEEPLTANPSVQSLSDGILPNCDPSNTDLSAGGAGCGFSDAMQLIYNIIKYITYIVIPLATVLLGYAGFTIMTSAGESEKITQAKKMASMVLIGVLFIFLSTLTVKYIFKALGVNTDQYGPANIKINETRTN